MRSLSDGCQTSHQYTRGVKGQPGKWFQWICVTLDHVTVKQPITNQMTEVMFTFIKSLRSEIYYDFIPCECVSSYYHGLLRLIPEIKKQLKFSNIDLSDVTK